MLSTKALISAIVMMLFLLAPSTVLFGEGAQEEEEIHTIEIGHIHPSDYAAHQALEAYSEYVSEHTDGAVELDVFADAALGTEPEQIEQTLVGAQDAALGYSGALTEYVSEYGLFAVYFLWEDYDDLLEIWNGPIGQQIVEDLANHGLRQLGPIVYAGERYLTTADTPVRHPDDLEGVEIRSLEDPIAVSMFEAMGATPTPISFGELYTALAQGIVEGQENSIPTIWQQSFYEQQDYVMRSNLKFTDHVLLVNEDIFQSIPEEHQEILVDGAHEVWAPEVRRITEEMEAELADELRDEGMEIINDVNREAFRERTLEAARQLEHDGLWEEGLIDDIVQQLDIQ